MCPVYSAVDTLTTGCDLVKGGSYFVAILFLELTAHRVGRYEQQTYLDVTKILEA